MYKKILCAGTLLGALGLGCPSDPPDPLLPRPLPPQRQESVKVEKESYTILLNNNKERIYLTCHLENNYEKLELGKEGCLDYVSLRDSKRDGLVDSIADAWEVMFRHMDLIPMENPATKERFEKADKVFAKYKLKLKDLIQKAVNEWHDRYPEEHEDPLDLYLK